MNKVIATGVIAPLLLAVSASANHVPTISMDTEDIANHKDYKLGIMTTGITMPFFENSSSLVFGDLRFSRTNHDRTGLHFGLGVRKKINSLTVGLHGFYDRYVADEQHNQCVGGIEVFNDSFKIRSTFYYPHNHPTGFKGIELEGTKQLGWISASVKPYYFFHDKQDSVKGIGVSTKFEVPLSIFHIYASAGYKFDTKYRHQATVQFGARIILGQNSDGEYKSIAPIDRNMFIYGDITTSKTTNPTKDVAKAEKRVMVRSHSRILQDLTTLQSALQVKITGATGEAKTDLQNTKENIVKLVTNFTAFDKLNIEGEIKKAIRTSLQKLTQDLTDGNTPTVAPDVINKKMTELNTLLNVKKSLNDFLLGGDLTAANALLAGGIANTAMSNDNKDKLTKVATT